MHNSTQAESIDTRWQIPQHTWAVMVFLRWNKRFSGYFDTENIAFKIIKNSSGWASACGGWETKYCTWAIKHVPNLFVVVDMLTEEDLQFCLVIRKGVLTDGDNVPVAVAPHLHSMQWLVKANTSVQSPQKLLIFHYKKITFVGSKYPKKTLNSDETITAAYQRIFFQHYRNFHATHFAIAHLNITNPLYNERFAYSGFLSGPVRQACAVTNFARTNGFWTPKVSITSKITCCTQK